MAVPRRYVVHQLPVIASLARTAIAAMRAPAKRAPAELPSPEIIETIAPRPAELVRDYIREVGGDSRAYRGVLPPHMFAQWGFPLAARTLRGVPYPLAKVLNGGCRLEINGPLPADEPLVVSARLESIDDDGRRAVLAQRVTTGIAADRERVVATLYAIVPLAKDRDAKNDRAKERPRVASDAEELAYFRLRSDAGLSFALLTGDFNPIHWVRSYAKSAGFKSTILHGFATMARAYEGLIVNRFSGDIGAISTFDVKFTRPLLLPADVGLYLSGGDKIALGSAPGGPAFMTGTFKRTTK